MNLAGCGQPRTSKSLQVAVSPAPVSSQATALCKLRRSEVDLSLNELEVLAQQIRTDLDRIDGGTGTASSSHAAKCHDHGHRCQLREGHFKSCACRRCLMSHIGLLTADSAHQEEEIMDVSGELHEHEQWQPEKIHYDYYSGEPLDEDLYQKGRDDELRAMQDYGVYLEIPLREAVGGKHIRGFPIAHMKGDRVRWRVVP